MASLINEAFTGTNSTQINGFNSWVASPATLTIQGNRAAMTGDALAWAYKSGPGFNKRGTASFFLNRYQPAAETGNRHLNYLVIGSSNISSSTNFRNNGIGIYIERSDRNDTTTRLIIYDGTTAVVTIANANFDIDASVGLSVSFTLNADGSGSCLFDQAGTTHNVTWTARTWTNGAGDYHGFSLEFNGSDGTGTFTHHAIDTILVDSVTGGSGPAPLDATTQTYTLTGYATGLYYNRKMVAAVASYALTGNNAVLAKHTRMAASTASFTLTGNNATFTRQLSLRAETASFGISPTDTSILKHSVILAEPATYALTGYAAFFPVGSNLGASTGVFTVTGNDAQLLRHYVMPCAPATFTVTSNDAVTAYNRALEAETADFELDTNDAQFLRSLAILGAPATYQLTGSNAGLAKRFAISAQPSAYELTSSPALITRGYSMVAGTGAFVLSGIPVEFIVGAPPIRDPFSPGTSQMSRRSGIFTGRDPIGQRAPRP